MESAGLIKVEIKRVIGPTPSGAAVLIGNDQKTFVVFVGLFEAAAILRELNHETPARPLTHELVQNIFLGFDIEIKQIVISSIIENTFCATLTLQQSFKEAVDGLGRRNEVRIDARPSDCLVLALKSQCDLLVSEEVFKQVQDVSKMSEEVEGNLAGMPNPPEFEFEIRSDVGEDMPDELEEDFFEDESEGEEFGGWKA